MLTYPQLDGFLLDTKLRPNLTWRAMTLPEYDDERRAGAMRSRAWCIPESTAQVIPARDSLEYQVYMTPGSVFTMYSFYVSQRVLNAGGNFSFKLTEACNDAQLMTEPFFGASGSPNKRQRRLPRPLIVATPGTLNVEICSLYDQDAAPGDCQLILWGEEPVE